MDYDEKIKLFNDVFAPKKDEKILLLVDIPHDEIKDSKKWRERREMANEWYDTFKDLGVKKGFRVDYKEYPATGLHNSFIPKDIIDLALKSNLVIAMTEFSASSSLIGIAKKSKKTRCASMPMVERRMEQTAFKADYTVVNKYATAVKKIINDAVSADITFSTGDNLYIDLRNRKSKMEAGDCSKPGQMINFPSGEAFKAPYEAAPDEIDVFGESKTEGVIPLMIDNELIKYKIRNNKIVDIIGDGKKAEEKRIFYNKNESRKNIAELGIGCNPDAVATGNPLEDEKVIGLHIGYGMSTHVGGKVVSDIHFDDPYPKDGPIQVKLLKIIYDDGKYLKLIINGELQYQLLK